jgi:acetolactate synthase I/II/III large subunit
MDEGGTLPARRGQAYRLTNDALPDIDGGMAIVNVLKAFGVRAFFNVPGESFLPVLKAVGSEPSIRLVSNRHESGAAFAAEAFAKVAGVPAVCMATRGPGASNLTIGIQTAHFDGTPLVALIGLIPTKLQSSDAFQEFDPISMFRSFTKNVLVVAERTALEATIAQALSEATQGRPGPVVVGLPTNIISTAAQPSAFGFLRPAATANPDVGPLWECIKNASAPAFIVSTAAVRGRCAEDVATLADAAQARVVCGWRRFSAFDNDHPAFRGSLGLGAAPEVAETLGEADLVVAFGPLDQITVDCSGLDRPGLEVVHVTTAPDPALTRRLPRARVSQVVCDPEIVARLLAASTGSPPTRQTTRAPNTDEDRLPNGVSADAAVARLDAWASEDCMVVSDAGDFAQALLRRFSFDHRRVYVGPASGAMGYGLPGALGAQLAAPDRPVIAVAGDGGLLMTVGEMETAARLGLSLMAVVFNNRAYGTIRTRQAEALPGQEFGTTLGEVHFGRIAEAMEWTAWSVDTPADFDAALAAAESVRGNRLIEVRL